MIRSTKAAGLVAAGVLLAGFAAGCGSSKSEDSGGGGGASGDLKTGPGITAKTIELGVLSDVSGVFAGLGKPIVQGNQLYWAAQNAKGGVCERTVNLVIKDHGYDPQKAAVQYRSLSSDVAALQQLLGSPVAAALRSSVKSDSMLSLLSGWPSDLLDEGLIGIVGTTYDIESENGLSYLMNGDKIKSGDKIGQIYIEGDYGESSLAGTKNFAQANGMSVVEQKVKATDQDLTGQVAALRRAGVKAVVLATSPAQTASAVGVGAASGLEVPYLGNTATWDPALLKTPAAKALKSLMFVSHSIAAFNATEPGPKEAAAAFTAKYPKEPGKASIQLGWAQGALMNQTLTKACENKDLSREGIAEAFRELSGVDLAGLTSGPLDYAKVGEPATRTTFISQPADVLGGIKVLDTIEGTS